MATRLTGAEREARLKKLVIGDALVTVTLNLMLWGALIIAFVATYPLVVSSGYTGLKILMIFAGLVEGIYISAGLTAVYFHLSKNRNRLYNNIVGEAEE
ncbi:MAG: hypothetical protein ACXQS2_05750 [Methermicoccaceae archaeon]